MIKITNCWSKVEEVNKLVYLRLDSRISRCWLNIFQFLVSEAEHRGSTMVSSMA